MGWGICKFCKVKRQLIKAHIIPEWMYGPLYDKHHKFFVFSSVGSPDKAKRPSQGEYEKNILCSECDNRLGQYEHYASLIFKGGESINIKSEKGDGIVIHHISGIDYKKFKLFLLSLLWKTSISSREAYQYLTLSPEEEERIKKMVLSKDPGSDEEYPVSIFALHSANADILQQLILAPYSNKGLHIFYVAGYLFVFADRHEIIPNNTFCLSSNGKISIPSFGSEEAYDILGKMYGLEWLKPKF